MAEWSQLPKDLLHEIQNHLSSPFYTVRFRSICSSWRNSIQSNGHNQPISSIPPLFSKRSILLLSPPPNQISSNPISWIIKIEEIAPQRFNLFYPLSIIRVNPLPNWFPEMLDVLDTRVKEMGFEFCYHGNEIFGDYSLFNEKIAFLPVENGDGSKFLLLTIHISGNLAIFNGVSMKWKLLDYLYSPYYDDVIAFNGEFYVVDNIGKTFVIGFDLIVEDDVNANASIVAQPIFGGDKKKLVKMNGELMLVDVYIGLPPFLGERDDYEVEGRNVIDLDEFITSKSMRFKVFRLDRKRMKWVEVKDLGNNVLFLGANSAFSASADDLYWDKGNCICFNFPGVFVPEVGDEHDKVVKYLCGGVYDLEDASITFAKVFWPPPSWVTSCA